MQCNLRKKFFLDLTLDSSEAVMFNQGGKHKMELPSDIFYYIEGIDSIEISVQISKNEQARFDFVHGEALKHKQRVADENKPS